MRQRNSFAAIRFVLVASLLVVAHSSAANQAAVVKPVVRLSEPVARDARSETFGAPLPTDQLPVPLASVLAEADRFVDQPLVVRARVSQVCQKKGCFLIAQDAGAAVRVSFKDYAFFVPTDIAGRTVTLAATLHARERTAAEAEHLNQDMQAADAKARLKAGRVYELVATSAQVPLR